MDPAAFTHHTTTRGLTYRYFRAPAAAGQPTLVLLHGFPGSAHDWRHVVAFFTPRGYGVLAPDMLGYGGTDKPTDDPALYVGSRLAQDIVDIMDAEGVGEAVAIAHDWGSRVSSRLANFHPNRFCAFAFLALGYVPPRPHFEYATTVKFVKTMLGHELYGFWDYFSEDGADVTIEKNFDSFFSLMFPHDPTLWRNHLCPAGKTKAWIESNRQAPLPSYLSEEDKDRYRTEFLKNGLAAPLMWYKSVVFGAVAADDQLVPEGSYHFRQPVYFAGCSRDAVCIPVYGRSGLKEFSKGTLTTKEFDAGHYVHLSHPEELNVDLHSWIEGLQA
ncbi:alpha/beta-hydrolase [Auriscalpium vulgare]|uniref:Alpha/beta-hydrolase n=1 Tax=Auriscalpium vulgare TaxID=40419 RepID=A0ACB8S8E1_9AGAM|nr:alpha/beta-hydrolase [Auriscalpium vulgare]